MSYCLADGRTQRLNLQRAWSSDRILSAHASELLRERSMCKSWLPCTESDEQVHVMQNIHEITVMHDIIAEGIKKNHTY